MCSPSPLLLLLICLAASVHLSFSPLPLLLIVPSLLSPFVLYLPVSSSFISRSFPPLLLPLVLSFPPLTLFPLPLSMRSNRNASVQSAVTASIRLSSPTVQLHAFVLRPQASLFYTEVCARRLPAASQLIPLDWHKRPSVTNKLGCVSASPFPVTCKQATKLPQGGL